MDMVIKLGDLAARDHILRTMKGEWARLPPRNIDTALEQAAQLVKMEACTYFKDHMLKKVQDVYDVYVMINGEYDPSWRLYKKDTYTDGLDDQVTNMLEDYAKLVTSDWMGRHTTDLKLWEPNVIDAFADSFAVDVYKVLTWHVHENEGKPKTPAQILAAVGVLRSDIEELLGQRSETEQPVEQVEKMNMPIENVIPNIHAYVSMVGYDDKTVKALVEQAVDADATLAGSALSQLGVNMDAHEALQLQHMMSGTDGLTSMILFGQVGQVTNQPPPPKSRGKAQEAQGVPQVGQVPAEALKILKERTGLNAETLGGMVGASRATYDNYIKGKAKLYPTPEQINALAKTIDEYISELTKARTMIDACR